MPVACGVAAVSVGGGARPLQRPARHAAAAGQAAAAGTVAVVVVAERGVDELRWGGHRRRWPRPRGTRRVATVPGPASRLAQ